MTAKAPLLICLLGAVGLAGSADAQETPSGDIIVIGQTPLSDIGESTLPYPAQTASDEQMEAAHASDLTDYLRRMVGGVFVNDVQNNPLQPDISYRGFTASPLLGTPQGLSVYIDGVRVNQPFGDVVSWDLIPESAIRSASLVPGSNPLFGRNSLGGALSVRTKDGVADPGFELEGSYGSYHRRMAEVQAGAKIGGGFDVFASGDYFAERGWRDFSPSEAYQLFGKLGWTGRNTRIAISGTFADTDLNGNGLQEQRLLEGDRSSVYTMPDNTQNRATTVNVTLDHDLSSGLSFSGNAFYRSIRTHTFNGDINDDALGTNVYQSDSLERAALTAAGFAELPLDGETRANTPFPKYRCIANALLNSEPNERCTGLINRSATDQYEYGGTVEATLTEPIAGIPTRLTIGGSYVRSSAVFTQSTQFGYIEADHGIVGVSGPGAYADGTQLSENAFDARVDLNARTTGLSVYGTSSLSLSRKLQLDLSARYDHNTVRTHDRITPEGGSGSLNGNHRFDKLNPALAIAWNPLPTIGVDAAIAQTSRAPSAIELGCADPENPCRLPNALAGDPPLKQVVASTVDGGLHGAASGVVWRIGAFRTGSRDDILFVADDQAGFGYFRNFGRTRRQGLDLGTSYTSKTLHLSLHYTYLEATYRSEEIVDGSSNSSNDAPAPGLDGLIRISKGDPIPLIPRNIFKASIAWEPIRRVSLTGDMIAVSGSNARGNENGRHEPDGVYYLGEGTTREYAVFNVGGEVRATREVTIFLQIANLLDKRYATAAQLGAAGFNGRGQFVARPFTGPTINGESPLLRSTFYAPGAPRWVQVGAKLQF